MRKKRFLAIVAAIIFSVSFPASVTVSATEVDETADPADDEQEEGEQTTIVAPGADDEDTPGNGGGSAGSASGNNGGSGNTGNSGGTTAAKSSDSSLAHLGISPGSLSPAFSAGTYEYSASVDESVTAISVAAKPNSSKAVIASVSGAKSLTPGANTVKVVVEAENGATSTYTITVNCGSSAAAAQPASPEETPENGTAPEDGSAQGGGDAPQGEITAIDDADKVQDKQAEVTFDDNGYLIYEGSAYIPSSMMPEGEYVSLEKYNNLYEQSQAQKSKSMRLLIIFIVILVLLLAVILNLVFKLRDVRQDVKLGLNDVEDEKPERKQKTKSSKPRKEAKEPVGRTARVTQTDTSMIPDVKLPDDMRPAKQEKASKAVRPEKQPKPEKMAKSARKAEDLEILDLNDL